jgi:single-stranded-DNA-specific exonuclease
MEKWVVTAKGADFKGIGEKFSIDPVTARIIRNRDIIGESAVAEFLYGDKSQLHPPRTMKNIETAADIIQNKITAQKKIRIIGDYDIDGIQSTYILNMAIKRLGGIVDTAIPDRIGDGYGLNERLIQKAAADDIDTIVTCDNGIAARDAILSGKKQGLTIIVTDHHEVPYEETIAGVRQYLLPPADAIVNPKQEDCPYPYKELCGCSVAFKLIQVLYENYDIPEGEIWDFLQYAAFATIGDVMELTGENRIIVKEGLKRLNQTDNLGLLTLMHKNKLTPGEIKPYHVGFILGPCLNASGRLLSADQALQLLSAADQKTAVTLAADLTDLNTSRKDMTAQSVAKADLMAIASMKNGDKVLVIYLPECHESLAGIVAGRIREKYYRPVFILTQGEAGIKGSGRSTESYSMYEEMSRCQELFEKFGGHPMAAGFTLKGDNPELMRQMLNEKTTLTDADLIPKIKIDVPMPVDYIQRDLIAEFAILEPFGKGNEKPVFADKDLILHSAKVLGKNRNVLKLQLKGKKGTMIDAIYFGDIDKFKEFLIKKYDQQQTEALFQGQGSHMVLSVIYYPEINKYNGKESLQITIKNYC